MAGGGQAAPIFGWMARRVAFTMAEILLSLTIIGVVAAITLPSLMGNINERTWNTQRKALHARMSQAIAMMPQLNGYGTLREGSGTEGTASYDAGEDTAAEAFITQGLSKVLKINNICDKFSDCGIVTSINNMANSTITFPITMKDLNSYMVSMSRAGWNATPPSSYSQINTNAVAFETQNGESVVVYYNPYCINALETVTDGSVGFTSMQPFVCANFIYDLNGNKGPNTVGKDIGVITAFNASDPVVVAPMPFNNAVNATSATASSVCTTETGSDEYRIPTYLETTSLAINKSLFNTSSGNLYTQTKAIPYWSTSKTPHRAVITSVLELMWADLGSGGAGTNYYTYCIKR